jgi:hypothetical protein
MKNVESFVLHMGNVWRARLDAYCFAEPRSRQRHPRSGSAGLFETTAGSGGTFPRRADRIEVAEA